MMLAGLVSAVAAGLVVGLGCCLVMPAPRARRRLAVMVGVGAAVLGTLAARLVAPPGPGFGLSDVAGPVLFAVIGVMVMVRTSRHRRTKTRQPGARCSGAAAEHRRRDPARPGLQGAGPCHERQRPASSGAAGS
jgi:hypothetical protein